MPSLPSHLRRTTEGAALSIVTCGNASGGKPHYIGIAVSADWSQDNAPLRSLLLRDMAVTAIPLTGGDTLITVTDGSGYSRAGLDTLADSLLSAADKLKARLARAAEAARIANVNAAADAVADGMPITEAMAMTGASNMDINAELIRRRESARR